MAALQDETGGTEYSWLAVKARTFLLQILVVIVRNDTNEPYKQDRREAENFRKEYNNKNVCLKKSRRKNW